VNIDEDTESLTAREIESWKGFEHALHNPNARLFNQMLRECLENKEYAEAFKTKGPQCSAESLFMSLIFQHQKMINKLIESLRLIQRNEM
jgi:hypothetical protein